ncbi:MAG: MFS transporter [Candidatus Omnitrophota bacterium]
MKDFFSVLKNKNFLCLWVSQIVSQFGDRLTQMALIALMNKRAPGSTLNLAKLLSFTIIPVFLVGPLAGVFVDRYSRRKTMIISDILRGLCILVIPLYFMNVKDKILPIYIAVFLSYAVTRFFLTSKLSIIPDLVSADKLLAANSLSSTTAMIAAVLGFGIGGVLVETVGIKGGFYIDSFSFFISAVMISLIGIKELNSFLNHNHAAGKGKTSIRKELCDGLRYIVTKPKILFSAGILFLLMSGVGSVYVIIIVFIQQVLGSATKHLGFLVMFLGAGMFLGSVIYGGFGSRFSKIKTIFFSLILCGLLTVSFAVIVTLFPYFVIAGLLAFFIGLATSPIAITCNTLLHEVIPNEMRGKVFSSLEIITHIAFLSFMFISAAIGEHVDKMWILIVAGAVFSVFGVLGLTLFKLKYEKIKL